MLELKGRRYSRSSSPPVGSSATQSLNGRAELTSRSARSRTSHGVQDQLRGKVNDSLRKLAVNHLRDLSVEFWHHDQTGSNECHCDWHIELPL